MITPIEVVLCILSVVVSYLIMLGGKELVPGLLRFSCVLLAVLTAVPLVVMWARRPYLSLVAAVHDAVNTVPAPAVGVVVFGHVALAVGLARRRFAQHSRPNPEVTERERIRGRERVRMPPRGEGSA